MAENIFLRFFFMENILYLYIITKTSYYEHTRKTYETQSKSLGVSRLDTIQNKHEIATCISWRDKKNKMEWIDHIK